MITKLRLVFAITIAFLSFSGYAQNHYWQHEASQKVNHGFSERFNIQKGSVFSFDEKMFRKELKDVSVSKNNFKVVYFPNEKGKSIAFQINESPVFSTELSRKYPNIKSYVGRALDGSEDKIRFSVSHKGVQSMIVHSDNRGSTFMQKDSSGRYVLYDRDSNASISSEFICSTKDKIANSIGVSSSIRPITNQELRKFRLVVSAAGEYTEYHGGQVADALAAINATITRINEIFETDLSIQLELIANTDEVIFTDPETDPYSGASSFQIQNVLTNTIGESNYDMGILFQKRENGIDGNAGSIGSICLDNRKGSAYASAAIPEGDLFDVDLVAHEMGHQLGANHTWSFEDESTEFQVEPGTGTTIMGYAGTRGIQNVAENGDDYFHYISIVQIADYLNTVSCGETSNITNNPPVVTPAGGFTIPISTAFVLTGNATDVDSNDILTYTWEQIDDGVVSQETFGPTNPVGANFRSQRPSASPERYFPKLSSVIEGNLRQTSPTVTDTWETISDVKREMNFALTVRDNASGGGQVASDLVNVFVDNAAGPFVVTSQNTNVITTAGNTEEIIWDVANTEQAPINAQTVDIFLSLDGGESFPNLLAEDVPNDGSHFVLIPASPTTKARIMVKAHNNVFFAVNSSDFTIEESEIVLNFTELEHEVCSSDILVVPFIYETFLGFDEEATFSIVDPPATSDIAIFPEVATLTNTPVDITFTNTENLATGRYQITVLATTATLTKEVVFDLTVFDSDFTELTLTSPSDNEIDTPSTITLEWQADDLATSYEIEIATDEAFTSIVETGSAINNSYRVLDLENQQTYYWRVKQENSCGEGIFGAPFSFTTVQFNCISKGGSDLPALISDIGTPKVFSKIVFFDDVQIADVNVNLDLDHSFLSDLVVTLTSPSGTDVVLFGNSCDNLRNVNATFDDSANSFVCGGNPAIGGTVKPLGSLSSFNGESTLGEWVLTVSDNSPSDGGSLNGFSLEICAEGEFRPDADNDGVFDDGADLCLGTPPGTQVNASGCPVLIISQSNYEIETRSESCRSGDDGAITIDVQSDLDYSLVVSGNGVNSTVVFTAPSFSLNNLSAGRYTLCITATDGTLESLQQCFEVVIGEPEMLSVSLETLFDGSLNLQLEGSDFYSIELNGVVNETEDASISLSLKPGLNTLKVSTNLACQGVYEKQLLFSKDPVVYPNPFDDEVNVFFSDTVEQVEVQVFNANGRFIRKGSYQVNGNDLKLDLSGLSAGLYFIQFNAKNIMGTTKVIKR
ncbi:reprolysin-like metallopeptidase [Maribacter sp. 2308TA10-17]|uniref:zinc-dependent metalloprotease n=1 Tax=Maribacter sp. 2308TA10-17 TaxID=3386276 RepID=UPI0039BD8473